MHHAFLIIGSKAEGMRALPGDVAAPSADVRHIEVDRFGVDDARMLIREAAMLPVEQMFRTFVIAFREATVEAQNALLKTLEEPAPTSRFYLMVPREDVLIDTVRSRLMRMDGPLPGARELSGEARAFLEGSYGERLAIIAEKATAKDMDFMEEILSGIEIHAAKTHNAPLMKGVIEARTYFQFPGSSKKMLLEHLSLLV